MELTPARFKEPFSCDEFVEKVSRVGKGLYSDSDSSFDPAALLETFEKTIEDLWNFNAEVNKEINRLESVVQDCEAEHARASEEQEDLLLEAFDRLKELGGGVRDVATKVVHVGDQLEGVETKRARCVDATRLMKHFAAFSSPSGELLEPLESLEDLFDSADIIQKLQFIAAELPQEKFALAKERIEEKLAEVEMLLLSGFRASFGDRSEMRQYAHALYAFKRYVECTEEFTMTFIDKEVAVADRSDIYKGIVLICEKANSTIQAVFRSPKTVMLSFIQTIVQTLLKKYIAKQLQPGSDFLEKLHREYKSTRELLSKLAVTFDVGMDATMEEKLLQSVFGEYIDSYIGLEEEALHQSYEQNLDEFYSSIGHVRRTAHHAKDTPTTLAQNQTLLSHAVASTLIYENQCAINRCMDLSSPSTLPAWAYRIFRKLLDGLCFEHVDYALSIAMDQLPPRKPKTEPTSSFFAVVNDANAIFYVLQKHFWSNVLPAVRSSLSVYPTCVNRKNEIMEKLEEQLAAGIDRSLESFVEWLRMTLSKEQKKTDFKPPDDLALINGPCTAACTMCCQFIAKRAKDMMANLNGKNLELVMREFGTRFYAILVDHVKGLSINALGGMLLTRDLTEYEKTVEIFEDDTVTEMFSSLRELSALTIVRAENLPQLCEDGRLATMDRAALIIFLKLRSDYKSAHINDLVKDLKRRGALPT
eukprot:m.225668 g.225668  ORF g.225668 m.225668 type:complete len:703 (-) comp10836_c5_seq6:55-2163(-)